MADFQFGVINVRPFCTRTVVANGVVLDTAEKPVVRLDRRPGSAVSRSVDRNHADSWVVVRNRRIVNQPSPVSSGSRIVPS
jgi:hypothetical protein